MTVVTIERLPWRSTYDPPVGLGSLAAAEALGIRLRLNGDRIRAILPDGDHGQLSEALDRLRANREQVAAVLTQRTKIPPMPPHVRLVGWSPKEPPIAIESCSIVVDIPLFIRGTLAQLGTALADPKRWVGWTVPQLVDRLRQVGVVVELDEPRIAAT